MVDGYFFNAFANLTYSLGRLLDLSETGSCSSKLLWADQICIDQSNHRENSHQVQFMQAIYKAAERTFVVLSTPSRAFETAERGEVALRMLLNDWTCRPSSFNISINSRACINLMEAFEKMDSRHALEMLAFCKDLLEAKWWKRAWVGHSVIFLYGREVLLKLTHSINRSCKNLHLQSK